MKEKTRGYIEIVIGLVFFFGIIAGGVWVAHVIGHRYAPELGYLYILSSMIAGLLIGLLSGVLLLSGYLRLSGKRK